MPASLVGSFSMSESCQYRHPVYSAAASIAHTSRAATAPGASA